jgi:uncharacterized membrane protein YgcG
MLSPEQLDNLVAPIALYPDPLLGQVMAASTYPLEIVEAQQWLQANGNLRGTQLTDAARQQSWDASVQALVAFPETLTKLNQNVQWTTQLGNAFLAQPADVMGAVQRLRARAEANGRLSSDRRENVTTNTQDGQQAIQIQPADPQVIYVPSYDPAYIWGAPAWGYYPDLYYPAFGFGFGPGINLGFAFGGWGGWGVGGWGWYPNWYGGGLFFNVGFFNHFGYGYRGVYGAGFAGQAAWAHDAAHRLGVAYPNARLAGRYQAASAASRMSGSARSYQARSSQSYRGAAAQPRSYSQQNVQSRQSYQSAPRSNSGGGYSAPRSFGGGGHFGGGGGHGGGGRR